MSPPALEVVGVSKRFGSFTALEGVDLTVAEGALHAVIGPNGAGKTTLFNILTGQVRPSGGEVRVNGRPLHRTPPHRRVRHGLARSFQVTSLFADLTVHENVRLAAQGRHAAGALVAWRPVGRDTRAAERALQVLERVGLGAVAGRRAAELSHGQQRLLEVAIALAPEPKILLLDEPTSGMGVDDVPAMERLLRDLAGAFTILMIEHNMGMTLRIVDRVAVLHAGRVLMEGDPETVRAHPEVRRAYLGQELDAGA